MKRKKDFGPEPKDYIPGLGRGAIGFVTRSDIGPMMPSAPEAPLFGQAPPGYVAGAGRAYGMGNKPAGAGGESNEKEDISDANYDKWSGYEGNLFANSQYDDEDRKADNDYSNIDNYMDQRRKKNREQKIKEEMERMRQKKPPINHIFADIKKDLGKMSKEEWEAIPETKNYGVKRKKYSRVMPIPDSVIQQALNDAQHVNSIDTKISGAMSAIPQTPLTEVSTANRLILQVRLDQAQDSVSGQSVVK